MKRMIFLVFCFGFLVGFTPVKAESFTWPSDGYIGWRFYDDTNGQEGINGTYHTGVDIWSNANGGWNNGVQGNSNPVYAAYPGQVVYIDSLGMQIKHNDALYTNYWHVRNQQVSVGTNVTQNTLLGYQDMSQVVHVHITVTSASLLAGNHDTNGDLDPSPYFGLQLDVRKPNVIAFGTHVSRSYGCGGVNVVINYNITGNITCSASNSITIIPSSSLVGEQIYNIR